MPTRSSLGIAGWPVLLPVAALLGCSLPQTTLPATAWVGPGIDGGAGADATDARVAADRLEAAPPPVCQTMSIDLDAPEGDVIIVADRALHSGTSNRSDCQSCTTYWASLKDAIATLTGNFADRFRSGLKLVPSPSVDNVCQVTATLDAPLAADGGEAMMSVLESTGPGGQAPVHLGLRAAVNHFAASRTATPKMIVLALAGLPTCGGADVAQSNVADTLAEINQAAAGGVPVFVMGFGADRSQLDTFAKAGLTTTAYSAYEPWDLHFDMYMHAANNAPCTYELPAGIGTKPSVQVYFDGAPVTQDPVSGFSVDPEKGTVTLNGASCSELRGSDTYSVTVDINCP